MTGATPIFCDINKDDLQINIEDCHKLISRRTKAIMPVHLYGFAADMDKVMTFAKQYKIKVIEDAAQALGIKWNNKGCGSFGDVATFSFFADKTITTGEGGFVCTNNEKTYTRLLYLRNQGRLNRGTFIHPEIGFNFRITDIQAAVGMKQLDKFDDIIKRKKEIYNQYCKNLSQYKDCIKIYSPKSEVSPHIPFRVILETKKNNAKNLMSFMEKKNIETRSFFYPLHKQPCFKQIILKQKRKFWRKKSKCLNAEHAYDNGVCLPSFVSLTNDEINYVCDVIKEFYTEAYLQTDKNEI